VLILISSLMVWNKTPPKIIEVGAPARAEGAEGEGNPPAEEAQAPAEEGASPEAQQIRMFKESPEKDLVEKKYQ
jgi:hypothetical protein